MKMQYYISKSCFKTEVFASRHCRAQRGNLFSDITPMRLLRRVERSNDSSAMTMITSVFHDLPNLI